MGFDKIANTNNFFLIKKNYATFWGLDIVSKTIVLNKNLSMLKNKLKLPNNEVIEIYDYGTYKFFSEAY